MGKNITVVILLSNLLFYIGIFGAVYLFLMDDNTPKWLLAILCVVVGIIGSAIPDAMINVGIEQINVNLVRISMLLKYFSFLICSTFLDIITIPVIIGISLLLVGDLVMESLLLREIFGKNISITAFMERSKKLDTSPLEGTIKYLVCNILAVILFLNIHENVIEGVAMLILCVGLHGYISENVIKKMKFSSPKSKWKIRSVLWGLEAIMLILAYFEKSMAVCTIFGSYYTVVTDLIMRRKTSIFASSK